MTVDRVHVLATLALDRHAAYVALSRHRDRVDLHYGRDDFADRAKLGRMLSRERAKDMARDYAPAPKVPEPAKKRDPFAGLKLRMEPLPDRKPPAPEKPSVLSTGTRQLLAGTSRSSPPRSCGTRGSCAICALPTPWVRTTPGNRALN
ncbi:hypothetical protein [Pelagerythrobacter rhizovicinus]|uniref:hypothetical protein n=1 Tax=Pelagerythrobacter rhizovicinus TaxID=2268576 RepID=UPI00268C51D2|nr:hypothetical protein [Pelagerythrobacter rhizovicinus]